MCRPNPLNEGTPGGTAVILVNKLVNRKTNVIIDQTGLGRWSGSTFALPLSKLHVITCYRPNIDNKINSNTTYQQQRGILQQQGQDNPNPSLQMLTDLVKLVQTLQQQQDTVIVMWDANAPLSHKLIQDFQTKTELISLLQETPTNFSTYTRGTKVIDHILGSKSLLPLITKSGYLPFYGGAWLSDHRPMFIDLHLNINTTSNIPRPSSNLLSNNHTAVKKFLEKIQSTAIIPVLLQQILSLEAKQEWTVEDHIMFESIDTSLTKLLTTSEQSLQSQYDHPWSPPLHEAYEIHRYWQIQKMSKNNRIRQSNTSTKLEEK
jgi:Endonuclease/Exonuclease/phosphatase family